jgi:hypothetical protein
MLDLGVDLPSFRLMEYSFQKIMDIEQTSPKSQLADIMCSYAEYPVIYKGCTADLKHVCSKRQGCACEDAKKRPNPQLCPNPTKVLWQLGSSNILGNCYKCANLQ